jgi:hypothetical protein
MSFGKRLRFLAVSRWFRHYVRYHKLKEGLAQVASKMLSPGAFHAIFAAEVRFVDSFFTLQLEREIPRLRTLISRCHDYVMSEICSIPGLLSIEEAFMALGRT